MLGRTIIPAVAVLAGAAVAQTSVCSQATATINSQADATALASCSTISGSILIGTAASGVISIDGPEQVTGDFIAENAGGMTSLGSTTIGTIGGSFTLNNLTLLSTLSMSDLTSVDTIAWTALPALNSLTFPAVVSSASSVTISNTYLGTLDGINLDTVGSMDINNNNQLKTFSTQIANITDMITIDSNGEDLAVEFPNLIWASNITLRNVSSATFPSLAAVNGSFGLYGNYLTSVLAPNLTAVGSKGSNTGSLAIVSNDQLSNLSMPLLASVGGALQIANNTELSSISFPDLTYVGGAVAMYGNFSLPNMPALTNVRGTFTILSTQDIDCTKYKDEAGSGEVIQGTFSCGTSATAATQTSGTSTGSSSSATSTKGAGSIIGVSETLAGMSVLGGLLGLFL